MPAQRHRDCTTQSLGPAVRLHRDDSVMDEGFTNHRKRSNREVIKHASARAPAIPSVGCDTVTDAYPLKSQ